MKKTWWKEAAVYQLYPRSFYDTNGDGIGDLKGVIEKIDYLKDLGVGAVWLNPIYASPNDDMGYDISDYQDVMKEFGTLDDFDRLIEKLHKAGIKLIMDLVVNHTSDEHAWFIESRKSKDNEKRDYYIWKDGVDGKAPNNWASFFTPSAWKLDEMTGQYYLHLFSEKQPDLNWQNKKVRDEIYAMIRWWIKRGVDGFRMDVINLIDKAEGYPSSEKAPMMSGYVFDDELFANRKNVHIWLKEMKQKAFIRDDFAVIGETPFVTVDMAREYVEPSNKEMDMLFSFEIVDIDSGKSGKWEIIEYDFVKLKDIITKWQLGIGKGWNSLFWSNHDQPRAVSRFGDDKNQRVKSAKMLATLMYLLRGTPYIYQGEELGMTNMPFKSIDDISDIESINYYHEAIKAGIDKKTAWDTILRKGRDNARTPMQWDDSGNAGFTSGKPWQKVNPNYVDINADACMKDETSVYHYYKKLIELRKNNDVMVYGSYTPILEKHETVIAYIREYADVKWLVVVNFFDINIQVEFDCCISRLIISNCDLYEFKNDCLRVEPYGAYVFEIE